MDYLLADRHVSGASSSGLLQGRNKCTLEPITYAVASARPLRSSRTTQGCRVSAEIKLPWSRDKILE